MLPFPLSDLWALPRLGPPGCGCRPGLKYKLKWSHLKTFNLNKNWFSFQLTRLTLLMTFGDGMEKSSIRSILFLTMWSSSTSDIPKKVWNRFRDYDISQKAQKVCKSFLKCAKKWESFKIIIHSWNIEYKACTGHKNWNIMCDDEWMPEVSKLYIQYVASM